MTKKYHQILVLLIGVADNISFICFNDAVYVLNKNFLGFKSIC